MSKPALQLHAIDEPSIPVPEAMRRAIAELAVVRTRVEEAFEVVHAHATSHALEDPRYLVAMQSIDSLSQQVAAIERFLHNVAGAFDDRCMIASSAAIEGITLAAVAARLAAASDDTDHDSGDCDFF
ncbi:MAG: hypothetical protein JWN07_1882 [Hyphomicrobiales bacterium]|nr:hypothetical protein [Hyphomicrobiales bacterium]